MVASVCASVGRPADHYDLRLRLHERRAEGGDNHCVASFVAGVMIKGDVTNHPTNDLQRAAEKEGEVHLVQLQDA